MAVTDGMRELARTVLMHGPISRTALAGALGVSQATLTRLSKPFLDDGLFVEIDSHLDGTVGRPTRPLDVRPDAATVVGIKLTGESAFAVLTDLRATVLASVELPLANHLTETVVTTASDAVEQLRSLGAGATPPTAVGVTVGGRVTDGTVVTRAPFLEWRDVPLAALLEERTGLPVIVENDVVGLTEAEHWFGVARGLSDFSLVTVGAGIGYGLVVHDQVVNTPDTGFGLGGHIPLDPNGPVCLEGHPGCATALMAIPYVLDRLRASLGSTATYADALESSREPGTPAAEVLIASARAFGRLIALSANLTMQSTVVLSGEGIGLWDAHADEIVEAVARDRDPEATPIDIRIDRSGFEAWARGAAALAIQGVMGISERGGFPGPRR